MEARTLIARKAVFLDVDGTLIDSNDAHASAWKEVLDQAGIRNSFLEVRRAIGMGSDKLLPKLTGIDAKSSRAAVLSKEKARIFESKYLPQVRAFPHVKELMSRLRELGFELAVVTSAKKSELTGLLSAGNLEDQISNLITSDQVEAPKPDPEMVCSALKHLALDPSQVIMLGDTPYDIEAASQAGVKTVALRTGGWSDAELTGAVAIYNNPADLIHHLSNSPFGELSGTRRVLKRAS